MKELSIEEKAARYDRSLERARDVHTYYCDDREQLRKIEHIFPELKESEDERIIREIHEYLYNELHNITQLTPRTNQFARWLAWLEKQGEQKSVDVRTTGYWNVQDVEIPFGAKDSELMEATYNIPKGFHAEIEGNNVAIKKGEQKPAEEYNITGINSKKAQGKLGEMIKNLKPVNEVLEQKPADKVEPKFKVGDVIRLKGSAAEYTIKKVTDTTYYTNAWSCGIERCEEDYELVEKKTAWRDEDENGLADAIWAIKQARTIAKDENDMGNLWYAERWLKSLKERVQPQPKQEWRQDNVEELTEFENTMMHIGCSFFGENAGLDPNDTNAIKEQANLLLGIVPSKEWNEEDEKEVAVLEAYIRSKDWSDSHIDRALGIVDELVKKLKSLRPQNHWKPSDEQIKVCKEVYADVLSAKGFDLGFINNELNRLEEELKKLKG